jgi:hypothetical protein
MIANRFDALAAKLVEQARRLGEAAAQTRRDPAQAWRDAWLVWPLFSKD